MIEDSADVRIMRKLRLRQLTVLHRAAIHHDLPKLPENI